MMDTLFSNVKKLYDFELYENVMPLASYLHTAYENDKTLLTPEQEFHLIMYEANSLYNRRKFRSAEPYFLEGLQTKRELMRMKSSGDNSTEAAYDPFPEPELIYRLAVCLNEVRSGREAIAALQSVPTKQRTPKMNLMLARLQHLGGYESGAKMAYKDILRECPLHFEAIKGLLALGIPGVDINSLIVNTLFSPQCADWLSNWIKGHDFMYNHKIGLAVESFKLINLNSRLRNNELLLVLLGECLYYNGNFDSATRYLSQAHMKKPTLVEGLMALSVLYSKKNRQHELQKLTMPALSIHELTSEHWFVLAQSLYSVGKSDKAVYFAQKAIYKDSRNVEAILLKVKICISLKKYREALSNLHTLQALAPYRFEIYKGLVDCYMGTNRYSEAQTIAAHAVRTIGQTPRCMVLLARTFQKDGVYDKKAKSFLVRALDVDEYYATAVYMLAEILRSEGDISSALRILKKQVAAYPNCSLHSMIGDILSERDLDGALEHYTIALNLDPTNTRALSGLNAMGHTVNTSIAEETQYPISAPPTTIERPTYEEN